ncbi:hypothetical protein [Streptomyces atroolivaceus]|nr:hypothetical protein [Streptomyces atroolivaceus]
MRPLIWGPAPVCATAALKATLVTPTAPSGLPLRAARTFTQRFS